MMSQQCTLCFGYPTLSDFHIQILLHQISLFSDLEVERHVGACVTACRTDLFNKSKQPVHLRQDIPVQYWLQILKHGVPQLAMEAPSLD